MDRIPDPRIRPSRADPPARIPTRAELSLRALHLLDDAVPFPPVDLDEIAHLVGIADVVWSAGMSRAAVLMAGPGGPVILFNRDEPHVRQRFSIAHEIGHQVIHPGQFVSEGFALVARRGGVDALERACDYFAACLLMPEPWMRRVDGSVTRIARLFDVSPRAAELRMRELGLVAR